MTTTVSELAVGQEEREFGSRVPRSLWSDARRRLLRNKAAVAGMIYIAILILVALFSGVLASHHPIQIFPGQTYRQAAWIQTPNQPASSGTWEFLLGTDAIGRDVLSRLLYGTRTSLIVGFIPTTIILLVGTLIGLIAGYHGGAVDAVLMRFAEIVYSFPAFLFFIIVMAALKETAIGKLWKERLPDPVRSLIVGWLGQCVAVGARPGVGSQRERVYRSRPRSRRAPA
jgi:oligopeptide transport system permease protein